MFCFNFVYTLIMAVTSASRLSASEMDEIVIPLPMGTLHNGKKIPLVGLGCASGVRQNHVSSALSIGYRFLDTAQSYNWGYHEDEVGTALRNFKNDEENDPVFIQTKIHPEDLGYDATKRAIKQSLKRLQVEKIDSVLIHKPHCWPGACTKEPEGTWQESWKALEELYDEGVIAHSIGICDVSEGLLDELLSQRIKPHIIQNWMDPLHQDRYMRQKIQSHNIIYQAYSSLGTQWHHHRGHSKNPVLSNPVLQDIASAHSDVGADVGQVVINWATTHHGISILPASTNPRRQNGNLHNSFRFTLTEEELNRIDALDGNVPEARSSNEVSIKFQSDYLVDVYWIGHDGSEEVPVGSVESGQDLSLNTYIGHTFRFKDKDENVYSDHTIEQDEGNRQVYVIVPEDEDEL